MPRPSRRVLSSIWARPETVGNRLAANSFLHIGRTGLTASSWLYLCSACHNEILWKIPHNPNMKTEITIAIVLLATGIAATHLFARKANQPISAAKSAHLAIEAAQSAAVANWTPPETARTQSTTEEEAPRVASNPNTTTAVDGDVQPNHNQLIFNAARALNDSPPLKARLRYKINLFGEQISGPGKYFQKGQGTRLSRMQFEFGFNQSSVQIHQFCDGDMLYTLSVAGDKTNLEFVDLRKLDSLQQEVSSASRVGSWLSVGSLTGLMEQLSTHFVFTEAEETLLDTIPVMVVTGHWHPASLNRLLEGQPESRAATAETVYWQQLPKHLPHQVSMTLGMDHKFPYFPYRIVFKQFELKEGEMITKDIAVLELFELKQAIDLSDEMFTIPNLETPPVDSTEFYRKRILQFTR